MAVTDETSSSKARHQQWCDWVLAETSKGSAAADKFIRGKPSGQLFEVDPEMDSEAPMGPRSIIFIVVNRCGMKCGEWVRRTTRQTSPS